ncbi:unnamed protein product (macronuclear) [Paramecium tetraurelia]|uniref:HSF-type DNA-binding domain-containing protein n=1 Tax=Paramecium tetraurelia TaxID=5888 RepID=A0C3U9_PARTE|nr:uncharacterized protein GSPATT00034945001 [Paramecium tetraurelia]CAK65466.1 unnamed protein product [Paramecium tetraurelia]|eukprot:XP_001432863.1 hypothetical protein (macronuclear) [Paramecium tetraurelia strain d4-2]
MDLRNYATILEQHLNYVQCEKFYRIMNELICGFLSKSQIYYIQLNIIRKWEIRKNSYKNFLVFLKYLLVQLQSKEHEDCIQWSQDGNSLVVISAELFEEKVMPCYFNSTKISTFYRQLSQYGFKVKQNEMRQKQFYHSNFQQGNLQFYNIYSQRRKKIQAQLDHNKCISEENKQLNNQLKVLQKQQLAIQAQLNIHTQIYMRFCNQMKYVFDVSIEIFQYLKQDEDCEEDYKKFFDSVISVFKGFNHDIAQNIFEELKHIGGPLSPQLSPLLFPYLRLN